MNKEHDWVELVGGDHAACNECGIVDIGYARLQPCPPWGAAAEEKPQGIDSEIALIVQEELKADKLDRLGVVKELKLIREFLNKCESITVKDSGGMGVIFEYSGAKPKTWFIDAYCKLQNLISKLEP